MRSRLRQSGLTLLETLVATAIILTLIGVLATAGKKIRLRSDIDLTRSTMGVLDTALQVYYDTHGDFPPMASDQAEFETLLGGVDITANFPVSNDPAGDEYDDDWRNAVMYYYLDREPKSRKIIGALVDQMVTGKDANGVVLQVQIPTGATAGPLVRVLDAWGTPLDYRYDTDSVNPPHFPGTADFPQIRSAGPDKKMTAGADKEDDITNL